ncbi:MAG: hypothetical protein WED15_02665 [Akkermansiaceae bacterium]
MKTITKQLYRCGATFATAALLPSVALAQDQAGAAAQPGQAQAAAQAGVSLTQWNPDAREAAENMIEKYGRPQEVTEQRLIWHNQGEWKRTEVVNEAIPHNFPKPHKDMLYQTISYAVPEDKVGEVAALSGSIIVDRVKGEVTARCDAEKANFLSLNLVHDIVQGNKSPEEARRIYAEAMKQDKHQEYLEGFIFEVPKKDTGNPGEAFEL